MTTQNNDLLIKNLIDFGLSEKEAKIYLALLELEVASVQEVAKTANINRSSAYVVLESLKKQGLVGVSNDKKIQRYIATSPEVLSQTAKARTRNQQAVEEGIVGILPDLKAFYKGTKKKPKVRVFEGKQGLINGMELALDNQEKKIRVFSSGENILKILGEYLLGWSDKRCKRGIELHGIYVDNQFSKTLIGMRNELVKVVYVSKEKYPSLVDMIISGDNVGYLVVDKEEISTIVLESKEIAVAMKGIFDSAWEDIKRTGVKVDETK